MGAVMPFMPFISAASTIFGVVSGAMARSESGRAQQDAANYNAAVAMQNAQAARDAAAADAIEPVPQPRAQRPDLAGAVVASAATPRLLTMV